MPLDLSYHQQHTQVPVSYPYYEVGGYGAPAMTSPSLTYYDMDTGQNNYTSGTNITMLCHTRMQVLNCRGRLVGKYTSSCGDYFLNSRSASVTRQIGVFWSTVISHNSLFVGSRQKQHQDQPSSRFYIDFLVVPISPEANAHSFSKVVTTIWYHVCNCLFLYVTFSPQWCPPWHDQHHRLHTRTLYPRLTMT